MKNFKKEFKELADYVIIDCAAGLGHDATEIIKLADELILVSNPEMPAITDALKTIIPPLYPSHEEDVIEAPSLTMTFVYWGTLTICVAKGSDWLNLPDL